ncbi:hypothetical protein QFC19_005143 [Naganishia cerealis]|uniref:Uncharacterized protein n=1 Tax=Naganishia cerealis TaxID=610337 RepID=A0ACC2VSR5_9TREE|nr:hypothetical protein QFC19_005143 [Naganishia cerealis]
MPHTTAEPSSTSAFLKILNQTSNPTSSSEISDNLKRIRRLVLTQGIPDESSHATSTNQAGIRARVWKLLLRIDQVSAEDYLRWVDMGPSEVSAKSKLMTPSSLPCADIVYDMKVRNDTFRTLATDLSFKDKVREDMLIRLLEAFAWKSKQHRAPEQYSGLPSTEFYTRKGEKSQFEFAYVQGE